MDGIFRDTKIEIEFNFLGTISFRFSNINDISFVVAREGIVDGMRFSRFAFYFRREVIGSPFGFGAVNPAIDGGFVNT